jgi:CspA family cold shock protein
VFSARFDDGTLAASRPRRTTRFVWRVIRGSLERVVGVRKPATLRLRFLAPGGAFHVRASCPDSATKGHTGMAKGTVKWFNTEKGYGFIQPEDGGKDIFVHITAVQQAGLQSLQDDQPIEYELVDGRDGRKSAGDLKV